MGSVVYFLFWLALFLFGNERQKRNFKGGFLEQFPIIYIDGNNTDGFIEKCANKCNDHKDCVGFVLDTAEYPKNNKPGDKTYYSKCWLKKDILDTKYSDHYNGEYYKNVKKDKLRSTFRKQ